MRCELVESLESRTLLSRVLGLDVSHYQTIYGWGVGSTQITPIYPQYAGPAYGMPYVDVPGQYLSQPYWPWDTRQFGVYYVRGPW